jgi:squalene-hopene/tetraprenyl-beta-curcumene cyclase
MATGTRVGFEQAPEYRAKPPAAVDRLESAIDRGVNYLLSLQNERGYWVGELEADTTLESDYIFYLNIIGKADPERVAKLANYVRERQLEDGGWNIYFGGPSELNATIKAYVALRLAGDPAEAPHMNRAKTRVHQLGGLEQANSFTRFYLALAGSIQWDMAPAVPPELMLLPRWCPVNIYEMSSWTRAIVIPLAILCTLKPNWRLPHQVSVEELLLQPSQRLRAFQWSEPYFSWRNFFLGLDRACKLYERMPWQPLRERALRKAQTWLFQHLERSEGLAAIYPAMMNAIFALVASGYAPDDPLTAREIRELAKFEIEENSTIRLQPCVSPVWDTAIAMVALEESGMPSDDPSLIRAADWLLENQILGPGDWQEKIPHGRSGGWAFEFRNDFYPDVDDTAFVLMALQRVDHPSPEKMRAAAKRGIDWLVSMQNADGGWGGFDKDNDRQFLNEIPFADHNAMLDPSSADVTARVIECLGRYGWPAKDPVVKRGLAYLAKEQTPDGSWYGRWGVNYVYGTSGVLRALETLGMTAKEFCQRAAEWLKIVQNRDGGFGESIASYYDPSLKGKGVSTPSQTAWGLIGLLAAGWREKDSVSRGIDYLLEQQNADGSWSEQEFTGTGFPKVFYLKYHLYRNYFPLYALARYRNQGLNLPEYRALSLEPQNTCVSEQTN